MIVSFLMRLSMGKQVVSLIVFVSMFSMLITVAGLSINEYRAIEKRMTEQVTVLSDVLASNITAAMVFEDNIAAQELLNTLEMNKTIEYARVERADKSVFVYYGDSRFADNDHVIAMSYYKIATKLYVNERDVGQLILVVNNSEINKSLRVYATVVAAVIFISLIFSFLLSLWVRRRFALPLIELAEIAKKIRKTGDYTAQTTVKASGEIRLLQSLFNKMVNTINERESALEAIVLERTKELEVLNKQLINQAYHDSLTQLPNRALYEDRLKQSISHAARDGSRVALFFIDLDKFKEVNDTLGHAAGDDLLCQVSRRLERECREMDTVARIGGDEFTMLFALDNESDEVADIAARVVNLFQVPFNLMERPLTITMSLGVSIYPTHGSDFDVLKSKADEAMYQAKQAGRNQFLICR